MKSASPSKVKATGLTPKNAPVIRITLDLTKKDAEALRGLCQCVGGSPGASPRHIFNQLDDAIYAAGIQSADRALTRNSFLYFEDYTKF
jgi:hypothetical protein